MVDRTSTTNRTELVEHHASVTVNAPVDQVYAMFSHFNDFPKFMSFVKEVTYYDDQRSHWVAEVAGTHEWDALNENWVPGKQIGWRSTAGLENVGRVNFQPVNNNQTLVDVYIAYNPPAGALGDVGERLGAGQRFDNVLQHDLENFSRMVDQAPPGALDPNSSNYLFHSGSAAAKGTTTGRQNETMGGTYNNQGSATNQPVLDRDIISEPNNPVGSNYPMNNPDATGATGTAAPTYPQGGANDPLYRPDREP